MTSIIKETKQKRTRKRPGRKERRRTQESRQRSRGRARKVQDHAVKDERQDARNEAET